MKLKKIKKFSKKFSAGVKKLSVKAEDMVKFPYRQARTFALRKLIPLTAGSARFVAHRGVSQLAPENTLKAFKLAAEGGFASIETDIRRTKDHQLVLMHDDSMKRMCGVDRPVSDFTYDELCRIPVIGGNNAAVPADDYLTDDSFPGDPELRIPLLSEFLVICRDSGMIPMLELKDGWNDTEALPDDYLLDIIRLTSDIMGGRPVVYVSFNLRSLIKMKKLFLKENVENASVYHLVKKIDVKKLDWYKKRGINISFKGKTNKLPAIRKAMKAGVDLVVWTVDDPDQARLFIKEGVKWVASNGRVWEK